MVTITGCLFILPLLAGSSLAADLTLEDLTRSAFKSESYQGVAARRELESVPLLQARAPLTTSFTLGGSHIEDLRTPSLDSLPSRALSTQFSLGVNTNFATGTSLAADVTHGKSHIDFLRDPSASFYETKGTLSLTQSLWRNAFGSATRLGVKAGEVFAEANQQATLETEENWFFTLLELYYRAWLAQMQEHTADDNLARRERIFEITKKKVARGLSEEPDRLQVESTLLKTRAQKARTTQSLEERWQELSNFAKSESSALSTLVLDSPMIRALELCDSKGPESTVSIRRLEKQSEGAGLKAEQTQNVLRPMLDLKGALLANGVGDSRGPTFDQTWRASHPGWSLGFQLTVPLFDYEKKAEAQTARAEAIHTEAQVLLAKQGLESRWKNACSDLKRWQSANAQFAEAFNGQRRRSELEEHRFQLARVGTLNIIQAGDDLIQAEAELRQSEVETRLAAWRVRRLKGDVIPYLRTLGVTR